MKFRFSYFSQILFLREKTETWNIPKIVFIVLCENAENLKRVEEKILFSFLLFSLQYVQEWLLSWTLKNNQ